MRRIAELTGRELKWSQPSALRMEYELRAGDELVAVLRFPSSFSSQAKGESADGCWTFERVGFWRNKTVVRACGANNAAGAFKESKWGRGGTLELPGGERYHVSTDFWDTGLEIKNYAGELLLRLWGKGVVRLSATAVVQPRAMLQVPWLVMLGCYILAVEEVDASAAAL